MTDIELMKIGYVQIDPVKETDKAYGVIDEDRSRLEGSWQQTFYHYKWYAKKICRTDNVGHIFVPKWAIK